MILLYCGSQNYRSLWRYQVRGRILWNERSRKDVKFVAIILEAIGIEIELPIIMYCDNVGAMFMAENATATVRTKHVDARYHFVREYVESGFLKIVFVNSKENKSDMFTKNVSSELYDKHKGTYIIRRQEVEPIRNIEGRVLK
jgi:hypothetical protein